ncbi:MAG: hypothetical protein ACM30E_11165 [Nitrososphaerales archaeon]
MKVERSLPSEPLLVEIIAYAPTAFYHCTHCEVAWRAMGVTNSAHEEQVNSSLPSDMARDFQAVSDWVRDLFRAHCDAVVVKVVDAASLEGFLKVVRYGTRRFPAVIVAREARFSGTTGEALEAARCEIERRLHVQHESSQV